MKTRQNLEQITRYLTQTLAGYDVIPATWGWHIHKGDVYCGNLEYQVTRGWQGSALSYLPTELREELKKFAQSDSSMNEARALVAHL
ncbi:hypothetical protein [Scytonema sp. PCC 10023]|uniref:hypothetical protein n=1 Tax=Scytonema sp. PCC 10023 TaxID=1680591 RepID=UPI0039C6433E